MINERKIKSPEIKTEFVIWMTVTPMLLFFIFMFGIGILLILPICIVYGLVAFLMFLRTFAVGYLVKSFLFLFAIVFAISFFFVGFHPITIAIGVLLILIFAWLMVLIAIRDFKWRTLEVLELAAMPVNEVKNGYTFRPMPTGKIEYRWDELINFSKFIGRNLVSVVYVEQDKIVFSLNHSRLRLISFSRNFVNDSWVAFDRQGNISAHISEKVYKQYNNAYAFDQLCASLGDLYAEFFKLFQNNRKEEIIQKLDYIRL